jgi:hypothetical protein
MSSQPYLRAADDGTYELLVPYGRGSVHILPYCFHTEEDAAIWLASRKGREQIQQIHPKYEKAGARQQPLCASNAAGQHPQELERAFIGATHPGCQERTHADPRRAG